MKLYTQAKHLKAVPIAIRSLYAQSAQTPTAIHMRRLADAIEQAPEELSADQIAALLGPNGKSWTELHCDDCDEVTTKLVVIGDGEYGDYDTYSLCSDCLRKALALADQEGAEDDV